jgi:RNase P protein component
MREMFKQATILNTNGGRIVMIAKYKLVEANYADLVNELKRGLCKQ